MLRHESSLPFTDLIDCPATSVGEIPSPIERQPPNDDLLAIDLDHCVRDGTVLPWSEKQRKVKGWHTDMPDPQLIIERAGTYAEISRSGTGVHLFGRARLPGGGRKCGNIEIYDQGRFIVVTGNKLGAKS